MNRTVSILAHRRAATQITFFAGRGLRPSLSLPLTRPRAKMPLLSKMLARRGARAADSACLESTCAGNGTVGSNPTLSASLARQTSDS